MSPKSVLILLLIVIAVAYHAFWFLQERKRQHPKGAMKPTGLALGVAFVANFFDTLGIGSYATTTSMSKLMTAKTQDLIDGLFTILADRTTAADEQLPDTGVGLPRERTLSPAFIAASGYGTRCSSVVLVNNHGQVVFVERSFGERGNSPESTLKASPRKSPESG